MNLAPQPQPTRVAQPRRVLMCRPTYFEVTYSINPWMNPDHHTDGALAVAQWESLYATYLDLGFTVELIDPVPKLPDMVYTANGGFVVGDVALGARFAHAERIPEQEKFLTWFTANGYRVARPEHVSEGEGDILVAGEVLLAGYGQRSDRRSLPELERVFGREVLPLHLHDPYFYHLDTALCVLESGAGGAQPVIAYLPGAFTPQSLDLLRERFPNSIEVSHHDAMVFGLNSFSDGLNVVTAPGSTGFIKQLSAAGFNPITVDLSQLRLGGGGIKCCTLELHP